MEIKIDLIFILIQLCEMHGAGRVKIGYSSSVRDRSLHEGDDYQISFSEILFSSLLTLARSNL